MKSYYEFINNEEFNKTTDLCDTLKYYKSDKCSDWHNYSTLYHHIFNHLTNVPMNIFEVGIYAGSSVRSWKKYFKNGNVYCGDVNSNYFVNEEKIKSFYCDQDTTASIDFMWKNEDLNNIEFDIIIDDGKHEFTANINFLLHSIHKLKTDGIFIVEDLTIPTYNQFASILNELKEKLKVEHIELIKLPNSKNTIDNNILVIRK
jgi:hypothetical protein